MISGEQVKAGRALARWSRADLAQAAGLSEPTVKRLEGFIGPVASSTTTEAAIRRAFEEGGVLILDPSDGLGGGVRLARP